MDKKIKPWLIGHNRNQDNDCKKAKNQPSETWTSCLPTHVVYSTCQPYLWLCGVKFLYFSFSFSSFSVPLSPLDSNFLSLEVETDSLLLRFLSSSDFLLGVFRMPETSALCFSTFASVPRPKETTSTSSSSYFSSLSNPSFPFCKFPYFNIRLPHRSLRFVAKSSGSGNFLGDDAFGHFPWESPDSSIEWVPEKRVTLFTADGLIQIGGDLVPRRIASSDKKAGNAKTYQKFQPFKESHYMDPNQGLCLGALFDIAATNGLDTGRRLCIYGFCRSIEMLSDVVEDTVLEHGGEVVVAEKAMKGDLHEKLTMTVAVPLLWGVPPASETLHLAVKSGGGIVEKVYWQWNFL